MADLGLWGSMFGGMSEEHLGIPLVPRVACSGSALRSGPEDGTSPTPADAPARTSTLEFWGTKRDLLGVNCSECKSTFYPWEYPAPYTACVGCGATFTHHRRTSPFPEDEPIPYEFPEHIGHA